MSDHVLDRLRSGAEPSDMRQLTERVWLSVDERYLVVCLFPSNYQCFERGASGWLSADRPCLHVGKVLEQITGRRPSHLLPLDHKRWPPRAQILVDASGIRREDGAREENDAPEPARDDPAVESGPKTLQRGFYLHAELHRVYYPDLESAARHYLEDADRLLQELHPNMISTDRGHASVAELRTAKLRAAQRAVIKALLMLSDLEDMYAEKQSPGP